MWSGGASGEWEGLQLQWLLSVSGVGVGVLRAGHVCSSFALASSRGALLALGHSSPKGRCCLPVVFPLQVSRPCCSGQYSVTLDSVHDTQHSASLDSVHSTQYSASLVSRGSRQGIP